MRLVCALGMIMFVVIGSASVAGAQSAPSETSPETNQVTTTSELPRGSGGAGSILGPRPGEGVAPNDSGDRGGAAQLTLFAVLVLGVGSIAVFVRRDMNKTRRLGPDPAQP